MNNELQQHHRRSNRLKGYNYTQPGAYFITTVTWQREDVFGEVINNEMRLNELGCIVHETCNWLSAQYPYVTLDCYVVMPNHFHGIRVLTDFPAYSRGGSRPTPTIGESKIKPLGQLVGAFKTVSAKHINQKRHTPGVPVWQRDFYEHIICNVDEWGRIHSYIETNPLRWL